MQRGSFTSRIMKSIGNSTCSPKCSEVSPRFWLFPPQLLLPDASCRPCLQVPAASRQQMTRRCFELLYQLTSRQLLLGRSDTEQDTCAKKAFVATTKESCRRLSDRRAWQYPVRSLKLKMAAPRDCDMPRTGRNYTQRSSKPSVHWRFCSDNYCRKHAASWKPGKVPIRVYPGNPMFWIDCSLNLRSP